MDKIYDFKYLYLDSLDENSNVFERTPTGICWRYKNAIYRRNNIENRMYADIDYSNNLIAIVEGPYAETNKNFAFIIDANNNEVINVKDLFKDTYIDKGYKYSSVSFSGVVCEENRFCFFVAIDNVDFRFMINPKTRELGRLIESK